MKVFDKILKITVIISCFLTIAQLVFLAFIKYRYRLDATDAASIGIIGGADGPTAIFVATKTSGFLAAFLKLCPYIAIISMIILLVKRIWYKRIN